MTAVAVHDRLPRFAHRALRAALPAACALAVLPVAAAEGLVADWQAARLQGATAWQLRIDNDSLLLNRDDGFYSSGAQLGQAWTLRRGGQTLAAGWRIGHELYTASDIKLPPALVGPPDHPYAAWLYGGPWLAREDADGSGWRLGLDLGCLGPCAAGEWTQKNLHRLINQPEPRGWSRQVRNEAGVVLQGEWRPLRWRLGDAADLAPLLHARFGNIFTDAGVGLLLRAGRLDGADGLTAFLRADARAVAYNATLQGGYFSSGSPHTVAPKRLVGEAEAGLAWQQGVFSLRAAVIRRGSEIDALSQARGAQNFVRLDFSLAR